MKKILFPFDFSACSLNAFEYALRFAQKLNAEIVTLHVYELPGGSYTDYYDYLTENFNISEFGQFENFKSEVPKLRAITEKLGLQHIKLSHMLEMGNTVETILSVQIAERADYIVLGTKGASGIKEVVIGSVAEAVINRATTCVLAIPEKCDFQTPKSALFVTEFDRLDFEGLEVLLDIANLFQARVHALQVKPHHDKEDGEVLAAWRAKFGDANVDFNILASYSAEQTILDYIAIENIQLVALATKHKNFLERLFLFSLSRNLAYHANVPVMSIPKEIRERAASAHSKSHNAQKIAGDHEH